MGSPLRQQKSQAQAPKPSTEQEASKKRKPAQQSSLSSIVNPPLASISGLSNRSQHVEQAQKTLKYLSDSPSLPPTSSQRVMVWGRMAESHVSALTTRASDSPLRAARSPILSCLIIFRLGLYLSPSHRE